MKIFKDNSVLMRSVQMAAIALIAGFLMYYAVTQVLVFNLENSLIRFAEQGATSIDAYVSGRLSEVRSMAVNSIVNNSKLPLKDRIGELKKQLALDSYRRLSIADPEGNSVTTDGISLYVGDRDYFKRALKGESCVSDPLVSRVDGSMTIVFAVPIQQEGGVTGVLYATYDADILSLMTDKIKLNDSGSTFVLNSSGDKIASEDRRLVYSLDNDIKNAKNDPELSKLAQLESNMISGRSGTGDYYYNGEKRYMGYSPIGDTGWSIAVTAPKKIVFGELNIVFIILFILILVSSIVIAVILSRSGKLKDDLIRQQVNTLRIADFMNLIAFTVKQDGAIVTSNRYAEDILLYFDRFGHNKDRNIFEMLSEKDCTKLKDTISNLQFQPASASIELELRCENCTQKHIYCSIVNEDDGSGMLDIFGIDITERVLQEKRLKDSFKELTMVYGELASSEETIRQLAYKDSLTGLPNRAALYNMIGKIIESADNYVQCAMLYLDLDNFKYINDSFGHYLGDLLLAEVGRRLRGAFSSNDIVARFEGDEFIVFIKELRNDEELDRKVETAMGVFREPFVILKSNFHVTASCGISKYPEHAANIEEMLKSSDMAMYRAKRNGKNRQVVYEREMYDEFAGRISMENGLRAAIEDNEFLLHYQPQVDLGSGKINGFEALIRWIRPGYGMVAPLKFISVAEETGLIVQIGEWVLRTACKFIKKLNENTGNSYRVSVNISVIQLMQSDFVETVRNILAETGLASTLLELELTESKLVEAVELNLQKLHELRELGVKLSVDDFGKGFSSLSYLKFLPVDILKIDKSFVDDIPENDNSMIESIIHIGHKRNLLVVAEGVEKHKQVEYLSKINCDFVQGYYYSKPVPEEDVDELLQNVDNSTPVQP